MNAIQGLLQFENSDPSQIIYQVLILSDSVYNLLCCQLSFDLNLQLKAILELIAKISTKYLYDAKLLQPEQIFLAFSVETKSQAQHKSTCSIKQDDMPDVFQKYLHIQDMEYLQQLAQNHTKKQLSLIQCPIETNSNQISKEPTNNEMFKDNKKQYDKLPKQTNKIPYTAFKQQFLEAVRSIILEFDSSVEFKNEKQICEILTVYFKSHDQNAFWEKVQQKIQYKTCFQLKQYFQKSFIQCVYEEVSEKDKNRIKELTKEMRNSKPSEIVDALFREIGNDVYFRRKVVMLVMYIQRVSAK
ncbi:Hypothetical_protein [Hexamita inflata]|uniref:Hypothetical_protein n=1 Tax=Hexamita inflata TaxID=28002 RepID=A0AA86UJ22_9EUKA|nr:Hypothetical protein HINF_LOCUS29553 [Hexamita inflata]